MPLHMKAAECVHSGHPMAICIICGREMDTGLAEYLDEMVRFQGFVWCRSCLGVEAALTRHGRAAPRDTLSRTTPRTNQPLETTRNLTSAQYPLRHLLSHLLMTGLGSCKPREGSPPGPAHTSRPTGVSNKDLGIAPSRPNE